MLTSQRRALIASRLKRDGQVVANDLAAEFETSEDTIRRDLREMAAEGLLKRVHGGALPIQPTLPDHAERRSIRSQEKRALGQRAAELVKPGQLVFLDGGTTNAELARAIPRDLAITVATHSPTIAAEFEHHAAEVILIGGKLYKHSLVSVGAAALEAIAKLRPDIFFLGVTAIHPVHGLSTGDFEEAAIKRRICEQSAETWVLAVNDKFGAASPCHVVDVRQLIGLVVSSGMAEADLAPYREIGVDVAAAA